MSDEKNFSGSMTTADGKRVQLTSSEAEALWEKVKKSGEERAERLPDAHSCLVAMSQAESRLQELGWRKGSYCPRNGEPFAVCEVGSTGMWQGFWSEDADSKPFSTGYIIAADCVHRPSEVFFKPIERLTDAERDHMNKCDRDVAQFIDRLGASLGGTQ